MSHTIAKEVLEDLLESVSICMERLAIRNDQFQLLGFDAFPGSPRDAFEITLRCRFDVDTLAGESWVVFGESTKAIVNYCEVIECRLSNANSSASSSNSKYATTAASRGSKSSLPKQPETPSERAKPIVARIDFLFRIRQKPTTN